MGKGGDKFTAKDLEGFSFASASPQIADLMRRLYELRKRCGYNEDEETKKERLRLEKEARDQYAKMDSFEKQKANTVKKIEELQDLLQAKKKNELSKKDEVRLRRGLDEVQDMFAELEELQLSASAGTGIWAKLSKKIPEDIRLKREEDVKEVQRLIAGLVKMKNKYLLGLEESDTKYSESKFESVDNLQEISEEELLRKPTIDISEGLAQIKEKKHQIYNLLDTIDKQLDGMKEQANAFKSEIQTQMQILDTIDKDVEKYTAQLEKSNKNLDATLKKVGGPTNLLFIAIGLIVIAAIFAIGYFAISTYVKI